MKSGITVETYAIYDNGSAGCFMSNNLKENLNTSGDAVNIDLQTMHGRECIDTESVTDLIVLDRTGDNPLHMPRTFTRS